jgi:hypothetical protein
MPKRPTNDFGTWRLKRRTMVLVTTEPGYEYEVDLEECTTPAQTLDWIMQVAGKPWGTPQVVGDLALAINTVMIPQENLCSFGHNLTITNPRRFLRDCFKRLDEDHRQEREREARRQEALRTGVYVAKDGSRYPCPRLGELPIEAYMIKW